MGDKGAVVLDWKRMGWDGGDVFGQFIREEKRREEKRREEKRREENDGITGSRTKAMDEKG